MTKQKIKMEIKRVNGNSFLLFEVDKSLEDIFKKQKKEIKTSQSWKGLKFYSIPDLLEDENYQALLRSFRLRDDYGTTLYSGGYFNIAFVRTVGGKGMIKIPGNLPWSVVSLGVENIVSFIKKYYEEYLRDYTVRGYISFEI